MRTFKLKKCKRVQGLSFSPNGSELLVIHGVEAYGAESAVWADVGTGEVSRSLSFHAHVFALSADCSRFVIAADAYSRAALPRLVQWCNPCDESVSWQGVPVGRGWSAQTSVVAAQSLALAPDGSHILVGFGSRGGANVDPIWTSHLARCSLAATTTPAVVNRTSFVTALAFTPDGTRWAVGEALLRPYTVGLFDQLGGQPLARFDGVKLRVGGLQFAPDGQRLTVIDGRRIHLLTGDELALVAVLEGHKGQVNAVAFSRDGRRLLSASHDGAIRAWDANTGTAREAFDWEIGPVTALAFAPDGMTCAAAGNKGQVVIWDVDG